MLHIDDNKSINSQMMPGNGILWIHVLFVVLYT